MGISFKIFLVACILCTEFMAVVCAKNGGIKEKGFYRPNFNSKNKKIKLVAQTDTASQEDDIELGPGELAIAGCVATAFGDFFMHPVDTVKTVQQASSVALSVPAAIKQIIQKNGIGGLYSGVGPYMLGDGGAGAVKFAVYEVSKKWIQKRIPEEWIPYSHFVCAAGAMLASSFVLVPGELLKQKLQAGVATSIAGGIKTIYQTEGLMGFFTGFGATLIRDIPYTMLELGLYDNFKTLFMKAQGHSFPSQKDELYSAALTGGIAGYVTNPLDIIKTKLMTQQIGQAKTGFMQAANSILETEGVPGLFKGSIARVTWLTPFTIIYLPLYEATKRVLLDVKKKRMSSGKDI
mmetsp:Transcript_26738/g.35129  ORF Transcript_26738/g.35129 Transcript_26738/m.35129 type:complete len:349 (-) Transcript_26738:198-1244(-)